MAIEINFLVPVLIFQNIRFLIFLFEIPIFHSKRADLQSFLRGNELWLAKTINNFTIYCFRTSEFFSRSSPDHPDLLCYGPWLAFVKTCPGLDKPVPDEIIHIALSLGYEKWNYSYFNNKRKSIEEKRGKLNPQEVLFGHQMALIRLLPQW